MADYQSKFTGTEIDARLERAGNVSNPNLLDNWYFGNPVDQRGGYVVPPGTAFYSNNEATIFAGTTDKYYTARLDSQFPNVVFIAPEIGGIFAVPRENAVRGYTGEGYCVDRWQLYNATYNVYTGELISNGSFGQIYQKTDKYEILAGKTVTVSILFDNLDAGWIFRLHDDLKTLNIPTDSYLFTHTYVYPHEAQTRDNAFCLINFTAGAKCKPVAVKLELGTQQTLAHQDANGNWVLNEIPDYGEQLRRCQRYYRRGTIRAVYSQDLDGKRAYVPVAAISPQFRTAPTVTYTSIQSYLSGYPATIAQQFQSRVDLLPGIVINESFGNHILQMEYEANAEL